MKVLRFIGALGIIMLLMTIAEKLADILTMDNIMIGLNVLAVIAIIILKVINTKERRKKYGRIR